MRLKGYFGAFLLLLALLAVAIVARALYIQTVPGPELRERLQHMVLDEQILPAARGNILSRDGRLLATSLPRYRIYMDLATAGLRDSVFFAQLDSLALGLASIIGDRNYKEYRAYLIAQRRRQYGYVRLGNRLVDYREKQLLAQLPILRNHPIQGGMMEELVTERAQPMGEMASRTIGSVQRACDSGVAGMEAAYNSLLKGQAGHRIIDRSSGGGGRPLHSVDPVAPVDGLDVASTLDVQLQDIVSTELEQALRSSGAHHGTAIVMEVASGAVRAMANLEDDGQGNYREHLNYATEVRAEPGSVFKIAALMAMLEDGLSIQDTINAGQGSCTVQGAIFRDTKTGGYGLLNVQRAIEVSSNVAMVKLMMRSYSKRPEQLMARLQAQRWDRPLGIALPNEQKPKLPALGTKEWSGVTPASLAIGYAVAVTPLHTLTFFNAIANGGRMVRPLFMEAQLRDGQVLKKPSAPEVLLPSLCSNATLQQVQRCLEGVVQRGTAKSLKNMPFPIAGKTGTANIAKEGSGYGKGASARYQASFVGYFPADAPRYSCIVVVNSPTQGSYYGGAVAVPVFARIASKMYTTSREWFPLIEQGQGHILPASKSGLASDLVLAFHHLGIDYSNLDGTSLFVNTVRDPNRHQVLLEPRLPGNDLPDVVGLPLNDALYCLEKAGANVKVLGRGTVRKQSLLSNPSDPTPLVQLEMSVL